MLKPLIVLVGSNMFLAAIFMANNVAAQDVNWSGGGDGESWSDPANWDIGMVPVDTNNVFINDDTVLFTGTGTIKHLTLSNALFSSTPGSKFVIDSSMGVGISLIASSLEVGGQLQVETPQSKGISLDASSHITILSDGSLFIDDVSSETSLHNLGTVSISGSLNIKNGNLGIDNQDSIYVNGSLVINNVSTRGINNDHQIFNDTSGQVTIWDVSGLNNGAIQNLATIQNEGEIFIYASQAGGIYNTATSSTLINNDLIKMTNLGSFSRGIENKGTVDNNGTIQFYKLQSNGIQNNGSMAEFNQNNRIEIDSFNAYAIKNTNGGSFTTSLESRIMARLGLSANANGIENNDTFQNQGYIFLKDSLFHGLLNSGSTAVFTNGDSLMIETAIRGIINTSSGQMVNQVSGHIRVSDIGGSAASQGINNKSRFENWGSLSLSQTDVIAISNNTSEAEFLNAGRLEISQAIDFGFENQTNARLENRAGSTLHIHHLSQQDAAQAAAITNNGHLLNMGNIDIFKIEGSGMISGDSLINMDSITIDSVEVDGIISAGISINESSGVILISNASENGLTVSDSLFNAGDIFIHNAMEIGIQNVNGLGYIENRNTMNVEHAGQIGLLCEIATTLVNGPSGQLQIQSALGVPLDVEAGGIVVIDGILDVIDE